jgi:glycosyltransferase involved in cell wall biosynthesis
MNIVRIMTRMNIGGPAVHALALSTRLDPDRFSTCLAVGSPDKGEGDLSHLASGPGVRLVRIPSLRRSLGPWSDLVTLIRLLRLLEAERPAIIHTHMAKAGALGRIAGMLYNRFGAGRAPGQRALLVHTFHGHVLEGYFSLWLSGLFVRIEQWLARRTDRLIAVSRTIRDDLLRKGIGRPPQWHVIPLGLDLSVLAQVPATNGSPDIRIGMVGRLVPVKNPVLFLEALHRIAARPDAAPVQGVIVGDGPLREHLQRETRRLGLDRLVEFTGWQRDLPAVYHRLDIACLTSWNEGTPVSLIEAMASGRAVVATDVGGVRDLLTDPGDPPEAIPPGAFQIARRGILVRPGDPDGLAAALGALASDPGLRQTLSETARPHALRAFAVERLLRDIAAVYETGAGSGSTRPSLRSGACSPWQSLQ